MQHHYKRKYHPLIILMYSSGMLDHTQLKDIPANTRWRWDKFDHTSYYGWEMAEDYIEQFDQIKNVYSNKFIYKATRFMCSMSDGFQQITSQFEKKKTILRKNAKQLTHSIDQMKKHSGLTINTVCRIFGVSKDWYYRHRNTFQCSRSLLGKCFRQNPNQLTVNEVITIERLLGDPKNANRTKTTIYHDAFNKKTISCGKSTFFNYARHLGFITPKKKKSNTRKVGFRATRPFEWLHVDITNVSTLENGLQKVAFVKDNFSGALLHYKSTDAKAGSQFIKALFEETFDKYKLLDQPLPINILSDGGSENKGLLLEYLGGIKAPPIVRKITAQSEEFPFSNSMSEITHRIYKSEFLQGRISQNKSTHTTNLDHFFHEYNHHRYMGKHFGLTPMEVLNGEIPDKNRNKERIKKGQIERLKTNQSLQFCVPQIGCSS